MFKIVLHMVAFSIAQTVDVAPNFRFLKSSIADFQSCKTMRSKKSAKEQAKKWIDHIRNATETAFPDNVALEEAQKLDESVAQIFSADPSQHAAFLFFLARLLEHANRIPEALQTVDMCLKLEENSVKVATLLLHKARLLNRTCLFQEACSCLEKSLTILSSHGQPSRNVILELFSSLIELSNYRKAGDLIDNLLAASPGDLHLLYYKTFLTFRTGDHSTTFVLLKENLKLLDETNRRSSSVAAAFLHTFGHLSLLTGHYSKACEYYEECFRLTVRFGSRYNCHSVLLDLATAEARMLNFASAETNLKICQKYFENGSDLCSIALVQKGFASLFSIQSCWSKAAACLEQIMYLPLVQHALLRCRIMTSQSKFGVAQSVALTTLRVCVQPVEQIALVSVDAHCQARTRLFDLSSQSLLRVSELIGQLGESFPLYPIVLMDYANTLRLIPSNGQAALSAITKAEALFDGDPLVHKNIKWRCLYIKACCLLENGRPESALTILTDLLPHFIKTFTERSQQVADALFALGSAYQKMADVTTALKFLRQSLVVFQELAENLPSLYVAELHIAIADCYISRFSSGIVKPDLFSSIHILSSVASENVRRLKADALEELNLSKRILLELFGPDSPWLVLVNQKIGISHPIFAFHLILPFF